ncbi:hypothetical protein [Sphingomicrobium marinum]|uniref:hypothetical protein n=1 Tax=Sphingomicrobium marinum TaxID=1227950 RepID=UPI00223F1CFF|nr:hypothetical protein [Sphingomicrobium marinum]
MKPFLLAATAVLLTAPANAADRVAPTGKWMVGLEERGCTLFREFSGNGEDYSLHVTPDPNSGKTELVVLHKARGTDYASLNAALLIDGGESVTLHRLERFPRNSGWVRYGLMLDDTDMLARVNNGLAIDAGRVLNVELATGSMAAAIAALQTCVAEEG